MAVHLRKRGKTWYVSGSVKVGRETKKIQEHSTGCGKKADAQQYADAITAKIRDEILNGPAGRARHITVGDVCRIYMDRPGGVANGDLMRIGILAPYIENRSIPDARKGWAAFLADRGKGLKPATVQRYRSTLMAALNYGCSIEGVAPPAITAVEVDNKRVRYLIDDERERLLAAYTDHVKPIALTLCFQGCRTDEALNLDWRHVTFDGPGRLFIAESKNGEARTVPMHRRVREAILELWQRRRRPLNGIVFLNRFGDPYADSRDHKYRGGNPIRKAHDTACRRAGIEDFTPHDWRHDWACRAMMAGVDLETMKRLGGWKSINALERYTAVNIDHMEEAMRRMG